ncbi:hypothetical protein RRSWK_05811 [Rhodopirellula sp. SWK7]|nr:hypothetical protein RRSWK_05811 [Rhodopirellula sp. SWK7]
MSGFWADCVCANEEDVKATPYPRRMKESIDLIELQNQRMLIVT